MRQEGRGIGIHNKLKAYALQDQGYDTVDANVELGFPPDPRQYGIGAQILVDLGIRKMRLITNNPTKRVGLEGFNLEITETVPIIAKYRKENIDYMDTFCGTYEIFLVNLSTFPSIFLYKPRAILAVVVFPEPFGPMSVTI